MLKRILIAGTAAVSLLAASLPALAKDGDPWIHIEITEKGENRVKVNLPLSLVEVALEVAEDEMLFDGALEFDNTELTVEDLRRMWQELRDAGDAEFIDVREDDEHARIYRKGDAIFIDVEDDRGREKVSLEIPVSVVDVLFEGEGETLNLRGALAELQKVTAGQIVTIHDGDESIRIWIE
jgi:hypothetical protein